LLITEVEALRLKNPEGYGNRNASKRLAAITRLMSPVDQPPAPADMAPGQLPDPPPQLLLFDVCQRHRSPLSVAVLARQQAGTPLGNPESILQNHNGSATTFRAQKFPSANSYCFAEACG
jgi:hypothetical protein